MNRKMFSRLGVLVLLQAFCLLFQGGASAAPTLTAAGLAAGFSISQFADNFPNTGCCGPLGIAFVDGGGVMVADYPGNVRVFPTSADGQHADNVAAVNNGFGSNNAVGLAKLGNFVYLTLQADGTVVRLNQDGTFNSSIVAGIPSATGIVADTHTNKLFVSDCCSSTGIWLVDPIAQTKSQFKASGSYDGLSLSADGKTLYAESGGQIFGYRVSDGTQVFASGFINGADGTELGAGTLAGKIFVNTNFGELWEVDLADPNDMTLLVTGGTRGDFVTADPNGSLLFTQTSDIWRLTAPAGGCIGAGCNVPEPGSLALLGLALAGVVAIRRRRPV